MTILEVRGLEKSYGGAPVLKGVDLAIEQGEFVGVIGLSGSGKSTLLRCINRLIDASAGEILVPARYWAKLPTAPAPMSARLTGASSGSSGARSA